MDNLVKHSLLFFAMLVVYGFVFDDKPAQIPAPHVHTAQERELLREFHREALLAEVNKAEAEDKVIIQVAGQ